MAIYCVKCGTTHECSVCPVCHGFGRVAVPADELRAKFEAWYPDAIGDVQPFECYMKGYASRDVEVEALRADRDSWADQASERVRDWDEMRQRAERADTEVEALREDAERYRWLRNNSLGQWEHPIVVSQTKHEMGILYVGPLIGIELDKDIDAAMREGE